MVNSEARTGEWEDDRDGRGALAALRPPGVDAAAFAALLAANAWSGGEVSRLEAGGSALHLSEIALVLVALLALARLGPRRSLRLLLERAAPLWLALLGAAGAFAGLRGLADVGLSATVYDFELLAFLLAVPVVVLIADTRARAEWLFAAVVAVCGIATVLFVGAEALARATDSSESLLSDQEGEIGTGAFYASLSLAAALPLIARSSRFAPAGLLLACSALLLVALADKRTAWVAVAAATALALILSAGHRRRLSAGIALLTVVLGVSFVIDGATEVGVNDPSATTGQEVLPRGDEPRGNEPSQAEREVEGLLGGGSSTEGENVAWRLAFWRELGDRLADDPVQALTGAGFGPLEFVRDGRRYDFRIAGSDDPNNTSGPHNAFVGVAYQMGIVGLAGLVGLLATAALRLLPALRGDHGTGDRVRATALAGMLLVGVAYMCFTEALRAAELSLFVWAVVGLSLAMWPPGAARED